MRSCDVELDRATARYRWVAPIVASACCGAACGPENAGEPGDSSGDSSTSTLPAESTTASATNVDESSATVTDDSASATEVDDSGGTDETTGAQDTGDDSEIDPPARCEFPARDDPEPCIDGGCFTMCGQSVAMLPPPALDGIAALDGSAYRFWPLPFARAGAWRVHERGPAIELRDESGVLLGNTPRVGTVAAAVTTTVLTHGGFMSTTQPSTVVIDVSDPATPHAVATWSFPVDPTFSAWAKMAPHASYVAGVSDDRFVVGTPYGVSWIDASDPAHPFETQCRDELPPRQQAWWYVVGVSDEILVLHRTLEDALPQYEVYAVDDLSAAPSVIVPEEEVGATVYGDRVLLVGTELVLYEWSPGTGLLEIDTIANESPTASFDQAIAGLVTYGYSLDYETAYAVDMTAVDGLQRYEGPSMWSSVDAGPCVLERYAVDGDEDLAIAPQWDPTMRWPLGEVPPIQCPDVVPIRPLGSVGARDPVADRIAVLAGPAALSGLAGESPTILELEEAGEGDVPWSWGTGGLVVPVSTQELNHDSIRVLDVDLPGVIAEIPVPGLLFALATTTDRLWVLGGPEGVGVDDWPLAPEDRVLRWIDRQSPALGAFDVALPDDIAATTIVAMGDRIVVLDGATRLVVLDGDALPMGEAEVPVPLYAQDMAGSTAGLMARDVAGRIWWLDAADLTVRGDVAACREWFPTLGSSDERFWFHVNTPGGTTWTSRRELRRAAAVIVGDEFDLVPDLVLPVGDPRASVLPGAPLVVLDGRPIAITD